jgi:3',5'-cyclic AMP phosphodiesterase CpdA
MGLTGCGAGDSAKAKFAVLSDPHIYDTSLGTSGTAFETYLAHDRKMLIQSTEILNEVVDVLLTEKLDFVLVPGDLTKDGEYVCHQKFAEIMSRLTSNGVNVYVVPGNHDVNNPHAVSFSGDTTTRVQTVTPSGFASMYEDFGYGSALYRHSGSLSYVAEAADDLWLFAIDSCKYADNLTTPETSGTITDSLMEWILEKLEEADSLGKKVIGMMHHGVIPHFAAQTTFFPEYVLDNYAASAETLAKAGLNAVFTGHFHAQDIAKADFDGNVIYDIQTGSTVTAPSPYRIVDMNIDDITLNISSFEVDSIPSIADFETYKTEFITSGMLDLYTYILPSYGIDPAIAPAAAEIHVAHYTGDESYANLSATADAIIKSLIASGDPSAIELGYALTDWATDNGPSDNNAKLSL